MRELLYLLIVGLILTFAACSSSEQTVENKDDLYVFDEIPADTTLQIKEPTISYPDLNVTYYVVQIGAFTTRERAEQFEADAKNDLKKEMSINYSDNVNLFVIQLTPIYTTRADAEKVRNEIWKTKKYSDAWIVTVNK